MPPTNADDPLSTTDRAPSQAPLDRDVTADFAQGPPAANGGTAAYVPGEGTEPMGPEPERASESLSVPGYAIEAVLGRGGMGVVYKARHLALKRTVALKMILASGHAGPQERARFRLEAEAVARLSHANIVQIHEVGEADGHPLCQLKGLEEAVNSLAFSPDGERIITGGSRGRILGTEVKVWDARTGMLLLDLTHQPRLPGGLNGARLSVAFSPDGKRIAVGGARTKTSAGQGVSVRDARTGAALLELKGKSGVVSAAFSRDGARIATGHYPNTATVWDVETGTALVELKGHTGDVNCVAFSPDGKRVVTGSGDRTVRVWDVQTGATVAELKGHTNAVTSVSFSADGTRLLTAGGWGGKPGEVFVWDARLSKEPPDEEETAYRRLQMQPNPWRYRAGYLAARVAKDDFAAAFYLNLLPPDERKAVLAADKKPRKKP